MLRLRVGLVLLGAGLLASFLGVGVHWAQADGDVEMEQMVVTGEQEDNTYQVPSSTVEIITADEIAALPVQNLQELLELKAGITTYSPQGMGMVTPPDVKMRGSFGIKRTRIEVDGQQWNNAWTGYWYFSEIPIEAIKRVEIVLGPFEARFGEAVGGVIRIFTKDGTEAENGSVSAEVKTGDYGRTSLTEKGSLRGEQFSAFMSHNFYETANWRLNSRDYSGDDLARTKADHQRFHLHTMYDMEKGEIHLTAGYFDNDTQTGVSNINHVDQDNNTTNWYVNAFAEFTPWQDWTIELGLNNMSYYHEFHGEVARTIFTNSMTEHQDESDMNRFSLHANAAWEMDLDATLSFGLEMNNEYSRKDVLNAETDDPMGTVNGFASDGWSGSETQWGLWAQYDTFLLDRVLELNLGLRYDKNDRLKDDGGFSPKGSLTWHYDEAGRLRLSLAQTYRAPSLSARYSPIWALTTSASAVPFQTFVTLYEGNEDLKAETTRSIELGIENEWFGGELVTRITPYMVFGKDWVETQSTGAYPRFIIVPTNIGDVEIRALETAAEWRPVPGLMLFGNYQWQEAFEVEDEWSRLDNYPYHMAKLGGVYHQYFMDNFLGVRAGVVMKHQADFSTNDMSGGNPLTVASLTTVDAQLGLEFWDGMVTLGVDGYNLFDVRENTHDYETWTQRRNFLYSLGVNYEF